MKMIYGGTPVKSLKVKHYEISTNDCDMIASDLQAGKTAVAKGRKITGTGKAFDFATYGSWKTNRPDFVPETINVIQVNSLDYPVIMTVTLREMTTLDFSTPQKIADVIVDGTSYPITVSVQSGMLTVACDQTINIEMFYGRDRYI